MAAKHLRWNTLKTLFGNFWNNEAAVLSKARTLFREHKGGDIILNKDEATGIATVCIQQIEKRNAFTGYMMVALETAVEQLEAWEAGKGVIFYGAGHTFCSGGDLHFVRKIANPSDGTAMSLFMQQVLYRIKKLPLVTVAVIEGAGALGGGAELALACDWRLLAAGSAGIGFVHRKMGIAPAWGGATWLTMVVGYRRALDLMTTGRLVTGQEAIDLGLADALLQSTNEPISEALAWLQKRTEGSPEVMRRIKLIALNASQLELEHTLKAEAVLFSPLWGGQTNLTALNSKIKHKL